MRYFVQSLFLVLIAAFIALPVFAEESLPATGLVRVIANSITLEKGEVYRSDYIDVQGCSRITFYAEEGSALGADSSSAEYTLNAFFSIERPLGSVQKIGETGTEPLSKGVYAASSSSNFLSVPVSGPYVRVELKNLSDRRHYKIRAYETA